MQQRAAPTVRTITASSLDPYKKHIGKNAKLTNSEISTIEDLRMTGLKRNEPMIIAYLKNEIVCNMFCLYIEDNGKWHQIEEE